MQTVAKRGSEPGCLAARPHPRHDPRSVPIKQHLRSPDPDTPGLRDAAVTAHCEWQQSDVEVTTLEDGLDLEQVFEDRDPGFFVSGGVKRGVACRFVSDRGVCLSSIDDV